MYMYRLLLLLLESRSQKVCSKLFSYLIKATIDDNSFWSIITYQH